METIKYGYKSLCIVSLIILMKIGTCYAQEERGVIYRDYTRKSSELLESLRRGDLISSFKGMRTLRREVRDVPENSPVGLQPLWGGNENITPADMIEKRRESVLMVCKYLDLGGQREAVSIRATATVLSRDGICVTNYHVLADLLDEATRLTKSDSIFFVATEAGEVYSISAILSYNRTADIAFFKVDTRGGHLNPMPLGADLKAGETVHTLTHPDRYLYTYTRGVVSRNIKKRADDPFSNRIEITADYARGSSGGPIMDDRGNMIGMVSSIYSIYYVEQPPTHQQMNVKEVVPVSSILRLIQK